MSDELMLEKYVKEPIFIYLDDNGMLQCDNIVIADHVKYFDAATDIKGYVHGIYMTTGGQIIYFGMHDGVSVNKTIASKVHENTDMSLTENGGTLHILIACDNAVYHFFTRGGAWIKSNVLTIKKQSEYITSCPCDKGRFALIISTDNNDILYLNDNGKWASHNLSGLPLDKETVTMSFCDGFIEIYYIVDSNIKTLTLDINQYYSNTNFGEEYKMANGNTLNSKFIEQMNDNCKKTEDMTYELKKLSAVVDNLEKQMKQLALYKENMRQYETQINQLGIKIQELYNRFNGVIKSVKQQ